MGFGDAWFTCAGCRAIEAIRMLLPREGARRPTGVAFEGRQVPRSTPIDYCSSGLRIAQRPQWPLKSQHPGAPARESTTQCPNQPTTYFAREGRCER